MTLLTISIFLVDQLTKYLVASTFRVNESRALVAHVLHLTYVQNTGGAFGLFRGWVPQLVIVSLVAIVIIVRIAVMHQRMSGHRRVGRWAVACILGGALGNLADRLRVGYVVDFLDLRVWPVFNVADIAITVGVGLLILELLWPRPREVADSHASNPP